jgi:ribonuclease D
MRRNFSRSDYRSRSHDSAHENSAALTNPDIAGRTDIPAGEAQLITTDDQLAELLAHLRAAGSFAYDSEFIGELTYIPKLCLIQAATKERIALIDPLAQIDLKPFWQLIADKSVEKIVHAGQQDIEPVHRNIGQSCANIFDTQIAAGFIALAYPVALGKLVGELLGVRLGKGLTFTHWDQRPLSAMQLRYAADDVRYLPALRAEIGKRLAAVNHEDWAREECESLCDPKQYLFDPQTQYLKIRGATSLSGQGLAILRELTVWRDGIARAHDVPPRSFLRDEILLDLARAPAKTVEKLDRVRGLPRPVEHAHGPEIVAATLRAIATPHDDLPQTHHIEPTPSERFKADALWAAAQCLCAAQSIDSSLVASRQEIGELFRGGNDLRILKGWRKQAVGEKLQNLIRDGHAEIAIAF